MLLDGNDGGRGGCEVGLRQIREACARALNTHGYDTCLLVSELLLNDQIERGATFETRSSLRPLVLQSAHCCVLPTVQQSVQLLSLLLCHAPTLTQRG